ncbi:glycosyl hydrolase, family 13 [Spiroplasma clarkii]|nr:glycosyl hydrolase, family 13 [Spiroplasma clarkii]
MVYELYPQSFKDSNNDGVGDLKGIIEKLDYLQDLGVGAIWMTPIYTSPLVDNGYDIADYQNINEIYGSLADLKNLIKAAEAKQIKIIMDLVLNHTSDQHNWFLQAKTSKANPYRDYYIWRDQPDEKKSIFGGSAWTYDSTTKQYYFHQFAKEQPDLNWENPKLRSEISAMIKWWVDFGVKGFRLDVIDLIGKEVDKKIYSNGPNLHQFIKDLRAESWNSAEFLTVGECWGASIDDGIKYSNEKNDEFSMIFQFEQITELQSELGKYLYKEIDFIALKKVYKKWQQGLHGLGWNSLYLGNHDLPRMISKYGNDQEFRVASSKTLFTTLFLMEGTPFIYQGDEIGMTNTNWENITDYQDVEIKNTYQDLVLDEKKLTHEEFMQGLKANGRDHARTPMQWDGSENAGFSNAKPWIKVNENYQTINVENDLKNPSGIYNYLKTLINFRNKSEYADLIANSLYVPTLIDDSYLFAYARTNGQKTIKILANWSEKELDLSVLNLQGLEVLLNTHDSFADLKLKAWQTVVLLETRI